MMPMSQTHDQSRSLPAAVPIIRCRAADAVSETGWFSANGCSQPGIVLTGTKTEEANTSGARIGNAAACAVSGSLTAMPTIAKIHDSA